MAYNDLGDFNPEAVDVQKDYTYAKAGQKVALELATVTTKVINWTDKETGEARDGIIGKFSYRFADPDAVEKVNPKGLLGRIFVDMFISGTPGVKFRAFVEAHGRDWLEFAERYRGTCLETIEETAAAREELFKEFIETQINATLGVEKDYRGELVNTIKRYNVPNGASV